MVSDAYGSELVYSFNNRGQIINASQLVDAENGVRLITSYMYDDAANPTLPTQVQQYYSDGTIHSQALVTSYVYTGNGAIARMENSEGLITRYTYGNSAYPTSPTVIETGTTIDNEFTAQRTTKYEYSATGNVTKNTAVVGGEDTGGQQVDGRDRTTTYTYYETNTQNRHRVNQVESITETFGLQTIYTYDQKGRVDSVGQRNGFDDNSIAVTIASYTYDAADQLTTVTDALNNTQRITYNALGQKQSVIAPQVNHRTSITTWQYDENGNATRITDANNVYVAYEYDSMNRVTKRKSLLELVESGTDVTTDTTVSYAQNAVGQEITYTDPNGNRTREQYDKVGTLIRVDVASPNGEF